MVCLLWCKINGTKHTAHPSQSLFDWCFKRVAARVHIGVTIHVRFDWHVEQLHVYQVHMELTSQPWRHDFWGYLPILLDHRGLAKPSWRLLSSCFISRVLPCSFRMYSQWTGSTTKLYSTFRPPPYIMYNKFNMLQSSHVTFYFAGKYGRCQSFAYIGHYEKSPFGG